MAKPTKFGKKWRIRYLDETGKQVSGGVYDTFREAETQLTLLEAKAEEIKLGLRSPIPVDRTFNELCDYWLEKVTPQKRYQEADQSIIRKHLRPTFGNILIRAIGREQIDQFQAERTHLNKKTVANQLTLLISMLNVAVELNWLIKAPRIKKPKVRLFSADYRYLKNKEEIDRFLRAAFAEGEDVFMLYATGFSKLRADFYFQTKLEKCTGNQLESFKRVSIVCSNGQNSQMFTSKAKSFDTFDFTTFVTRSLPTG